MTGDACPDEGHAVGAGGVHPASGGGAGERSASREGGADEQRSRSTSRVRGRRGHVESVPRAGCAQRRADVRRERGLWMSG